MADIINPLISAFAKIERQDVRVDRIDVPTSLFGHLHKSPHFDPVYRQAFLPLGLDQKAVGTVWGSDVHIGGKNLVVYPEGWDRGVRWVRSVKKSVVRPVIVSEDGLRELWDLGKLTIYVRSHCSPVANINPPEQTALEALREMLTEEEFRRYLKTGFLNIISSSGKIYQVPRSNRHVVVWERGKKVAEICSYITDKRIPPTDRVLAFKTIIETDEREMYRLGNVYKYGIS